MPEEAPVPGRGVHELVSIRGDMRHPHAPRGAFEILLQGRGLHEDETEQGAVQSTWWEETVAAVQG